MRNLIVFNQVTLDGYIADSRGEMRWAYRSGSPDPEWDAYVRGNASGGGVLLFGRVTYDMMAGYWPTPEAMRNNPVVAQRMNEGKKIVVSRTMKAATWQNTRLIRGDLVSEVGKLKASTGPGIAILGSASIVAQLAPEKLIDEYHIVVIPVALGGGKTMFQGIPGLLAFSLKSTRAFANGNVVLVYAPA